MIGYHDQQDALKKAGVKAKSARKEDVQAAYNTLPKASAIPDESMDATTAVKVAVISGKDDSTLLDGSNEVAGASDAVITPTELKAVTLPKLEPNTETKADGDVYTYVGSGAEAPETVNFLNRQKFVRGISETVTDPLVLSKIGGHPCFVKGEADKSVMDKNAKDAAEQADAQRQRDNETQDTVKRRNAKYAK